ncbi:MAG: septum formation initiator family protein [Candidatus Delongbacteria bacterium]
MKRKKKNTGLIIMVLAVSFITYYFFFSGDYSIIKLIEVRNEHKRTKVEVEQIEAEIREQEQKNELLKDRDPFEMEKKAREKGMARQGEIIYKYEIKKEK